VSTSSRMSVSVRSPFFSDTSISRSRKVICLFTPVGRHSETRINQDNTHFFSAVFRCHVCCTLMPKLREIFQMENKMIPTIHYITSVHLMSPT
jgi:hypothetical protein